MTICLSAIAREDNKEHLIFATDHMISTSIGQFEHSITKYKEINTNTIAMLAGNPLIFDELITLKNKNISYQEIKKEIFQNFKRRRKEDIKNKILDMFGVDEKFIITALENPIQNPFLGKILEKISEFSLGTGILLIGYDGEEAQITEIDEEGFNDFRLMNFHAIGSGDIQAVNALFFERHDKKQDLHSTLYNVYKAKRNAEVLEGVGKETDILILSKDTGCTKIDKEDLNILEDIYNRELVFGKNDPKLSQIKLGVKKC